MTPLYILGALALSMFVITIIKISYELGKAEEKGKGDLQRAMEKSPYYPNLDSKNIWATKEKPLTVILPTKRKRGRPRKNPVDNSQK